jgi:hypothetical protein
MFKCSTLVKTEDKAKEIESTCLIPNKDLNEKRNKKGLKLEEKTKLDADYERKMLENCPVTDLIM